MSYDWKSMTPGVVCCVVGDKAAKCQCKTHTDSGRVRWGIRLISKIGCYTLSSEVSAKQLTWVFFLKIATRWYCYHVTEWVFGLLSQGILSWSRPTTGWSCVSHGWSLDAHLAASLLFNHSQWLLLLVALASTLIALLWFCPLTPSSLRSLGVELFMKPLQHPLYSASVARLLYWRCFCVYVSSTVSLQPGYCPLNDEDKLTEIGHESGGEGWAPCFSPSRIVGMLSGHWEAWCWWLLSCTQAQLPNTSALVWFTTCICLVLG